MDHQIPSSLSPLSLLLSYNRLNIEFLNHSLLVNVSGQSSYHMLAKEAKIIALLPAYHGEYSCEHFDFL
jgi:hypothetical protein